MGDTNETDQATLPEIFQTKWDVIQCAVKFIRDNLSLFERNLSLNPPFFKTTYETYAFLLFDRLFEFHGHVNDFIANNNNNENSSLVDLKQIYGKPDYIRDCYKDMQEICIKSDPRQTCWFLKLLLHQPSTLIEVTLYDIQNNNNNNALSTVPNKCELHVNGYTQYIVFTWPRNTPMTACEDDIEKIEYDDFIRLTICELHSRAHWTLDQINKNTEIWWQENEYINFKAQSSEVWVIHIDLHGSFEIYFKDYIDVSPDSNPLFLPFSGLRKAYDNHIIDDCNIQEDIVYIIGSQQERDTRAHGIMILDDTERWKYIPFDMIDQHDISKFEWFWPWYHLNDITLIHPFRFNDEHFNVHIQIVLAKREIYNHNYRFELIIK